MIFLTASLAPVGLLAIAYLNSLFGDLSKRLGSVTKMADYHRWFVVANGFITLAAVIQMVRGTAALAPERAPPILLEPWFALICFYIPLAVGVTIALVLMWYYWGWILMEKVDDQ